jgi:hypothetical protein
MLAQVVSARRKRAAKAEPAQVKVTKAPARDVRPVVSAQKSAALRMSIEAIREAAQRRRASGWQGTPPAPTGGQSRKSVGTFS